MAKTRYRKIEFDRLQMYFGEPLVIDVESAQGSITIFQPTIGDIVRIGEHEFYSNLNIFITNTTSYRLILWEAGLDWNIVSDFDLFCMLYTQLNHESTRLLFGDLDFSKFELYSKKIEENECTILYDKENEIEINEEVYQHIAQYLRAVFNIYPEEKITSDSIMKDWFIQKDKRQLAIDKEKADKGNDSSGSSIQALISSCVNHPGFKYKLKELKEVGICEFYDSVQRLQIYENTTALMKGMYSGMISSKDVNPDAYNFMKDFSK